MINIINYYVKIISNYTKNKYESLNVEIYLKYII